MDDAAWHARLRERSAAATAARRAESDFIRARDERAFAVLMGRAEEVFTVNSTP